MNVDATGILEEKRKEPKEEVREEKRYYNFSCRREGAEYESIIDIQFTKSDDCKMIYSDGSVYIMPGDQKEEEEEEVVDLCPTSIRRQDLDFSKEELDTIFNDLYEAVQSDNHDKDEDLSIYIKDPKLREKFLKH